MSSTRHQYQAVAASQTDKVLGPQGGAKGDIIDTLVVTVATSATGTVDIQDGSDTAIPLTAANTPIGVYVIYLNAMSRSGAWSITTGAGATALAIGRFA
jgi:hypothetical protein